MGRSRRVEIEKPPADEAPSNLAAIGRYVFTPEIFDALRQTKPGAGGEIQLTDAIGRLLRDEPVYAYEFRGRRYDCGSKLGYLEATVDYALRHPEVAQGFRAYLDQLSRKGGGRP